MAHDNKYKHLRAENPITALWLRRKEQRGIVPNVAKRLKMCSGKKAYDSLHNAEHAAETIKFGNRVYNCPVCKLWHATSKRKSA